MHVSRFSFLKKAPKVLAFSLVGALCGCGEEAPPYDVLPLRDALRAAPEVVATLSEDSRYELALRLREAEHVDPETLTFVPEKLDLEPLVTSADAVREATDKDAIMLGEILATDGHGLLEIQSVSDDEMLEGAPFDVLGHATDTVAPFEEAALRGEAGKTLRGFAARTHAKSIVRMTGLPMAAVAWNDKVYVNESWLVAMSSFEDACSAALPTDVSGQMGSQPAPQPLSVDFSPFDLPENLNVCAVQVTKTCSCATNQSCSHVPTDATFSDANAECTWVNQQSANASALCLLALFSLDNVRECVESASPACTFMPVNNRADAVKFVTDPQCNGILDTCLSSGHPPNVNNASSKCANSCDDCRYCDGQGDDCGQCLSDTQLVAQLCEACIAICEACADNGREASSPESPFKYASIRPISQCSVRSPAAKSPLPGPAGTAFWLFAPIAFLLSRSRRRP